MKLENRDKIIFLYDIKIRDYLHSLLPNLFILNAITHQKDTSLKEKQFK